MASASRSKVATPGRWWRGLPALCGAIAMLAAPSAAQAATYTVNTVGDALPVPAECQGAPGDCSLRQALDRAQSGDAVLLPASPTPYEIVDEIIPVRGGVAIKGSGPAASVISGNGADQVFDLLGGGMVTISDLTITRAHNGFSRDEGGAINSTAKAGGDLTLEDVTISNSDSTGGYGGAVEIKGDLVVRNSRFTGDTAANPEGGGGGAIDVVKGEHTVTISGSVFSEDAEASAGGGAVYVETGGHLSVASSTFSGNVAGGGYPGGAIQLNGKTTAAIYDSTFTANSAGTGGAIASEGQQLTLINDTLAANSAAIGANLASKAAGATVQNTIFATPYGGGASCSGAITSEGGNLEDTSPSSCGLSPAEGDAAGVNPGLGSLADNASLVATAGGPPRTLSLAPGSPAVEAGMASGCAAVGGVDERGVPRPATPAGGCDAGAFELVSVPTATALASSPGSPGAGEEELELTATVSAVRGLPSALNPAFVGTVEFLDGETSLGTAAVDSSGRATLLASGLETEFTRSPRSTAATLCTRARAPASLTRPSWRRRLSSRASASRTGAGTRLSGRLGAEVGARRWARHSRSRSTRPRAWYSPSPAWCAGAGR